MDYSATLRVAASINSPSRVSPSRLELEGSVPAAEGRGLPWAEPAGGLLSNIPESAAETVEKAGSFARS